MGYSKPSIFIEKGGGDSANGLFVTKHHLNEEVES